MRVPGLGELGVVELGERSIRKFVEHRMTTYAAALAYRGLFALFPFTLLVVALLGVLDLDAVFDRLTGQADPGPLGPAVERGREQAQPLEPLVEKAQEQAGGGLLSFGVAVSLWSVYAAARTLTEALDAAYEVTETRPGWKRFALSALLGPALAVVVIAATALMLIGPQVIAWVAGWVGLDEVFVVVWTWLRLPVALLLLALVLSVVYRFAPDVDEPYRLVTPGAVLATLAWVVVSIAFSFYLANFADYGATYGSLGVAIGLLFYLYLSASVVLLGAEANAAIYHRALKREGA